MDSEERDWQRALFIPLTILAWLAVVLVAAWLLGHVLKTVLTLVLAGVLAYALTPLVQFFSRYVPRSLAIAFAYIVGFGVLFGLGAAIFLTAAGQVTTLVEHLPQYLHDVNNHQAQIVKALKPFGMTDARYIQAQHELLTYAQSVGTSTARASLDIATTILGTLIDIVLILILSVYLTADGNRLAVAMRRETPRAQRIHLNIVIAIFNQVVGGYIRGQLTLAALIGFLVGFGMLLLHVPYAILLGVLAFFMEFIPVVGVLISGAICVLLALTQGWFRAVLVLAYFVFVHVVEGDVVGPRIMGKAVGIHPATALVALVAGTELFGIWGSLFAAPLAGLVQAIGYAIWREIHGAEPEVVLQAVVNTVENHPPETKPDLRDDAGSRPVAK